MDPNSRIAWHYTTGRRAQQILLEGVLKPLTEEPLLAEPPLLWFSLRQHWDPIANEPAHAADGTQSAGSFEETIAREGGAWRFGVPVSELIAWRQLPTVTGLSRDRLRALERSGRKLGSDATLWLAAREPVQLSRCRVEHLHGDHWCSADHSEQ